MLAPQSTDLVIESDETTYEGAICLTISNRSAAEVKISIEDAYAGAAHSETIRAGGSVTKQFELAQSHNWYDLIVRASGDTEFEQKFAGHLENGRDSFTDPAMGYPAKS